jgi:hypothetical protein
VVVEDMVPTRFYIKGMIVVLASSDNQTTPLRQKVAFYVHGG